jgi:hypothetical protein
MKDLSARSVPFFAAGKQRNPEFRPGCALKDGTILHDA